MTTVRPSTETRKSRAAIYRKAAAEILNEHGTHFSCEVLYHLGGYRLAEEYIEYFANVEEPKFLSAVTMTETAEGLGWNKREFRAMCLHMMAAAVEAGDA
jgi:hypothetical protein